jgi:hypothetical protein
MTLAAKARLQLRGLVPVRIAQAAWSQRQAANLMPHRMAASRGARRKGTGTIDAGGAGCGTVPCRVGAA